MTWIRDLVAPEARAWEDFYRHRWQHDRVVRSTHGVNCTGGCSWMIHVKDGIVGWEMQATDYPRFDRSLPGYEPRGCPRGITFSWYLYSPLRIKHPYLRGVLADLWREARARHADPVAAWASLVENEEARERWQKARGKGGFRRASWDEALELVAASMLYTAKKHGPDRVVGFSPIPAMSMVSYAAGARLLQLFGAPMLSFYDLYADFPPAFPETWGEKTDVAESADWFNSKLIVVAGNNLDMTRTPDAHFAIEAKGHGAKLVVLSPDFSEVARHADQWIPVHAGMDGAFFMAVAHVILRECHVERPVPSFVSYLKQFSDGPFLVELERDGDGFRPGPFVRANRIARYREVEHGEWKLLVLDGPSDSPRMPQGSIGFRWQREPGRWNLEPKDGLDGTPIDPLLSVLDGRAGVVRVAFHDFGEEKTVTRPVPVRYLETVTGTIPVATAFDLLLAHFGVPRRLDGDDRRDLESADGPFTPAWQERFTGIGRRTVIQFAREFARTAEKTGGRCTLLVGSGVNHWYHANLIYRAAIASLVATGCVGVNGGGLNHYTGQEKVVPGGSFSALAMALDWSGPPRLQNGPSYHYVHTDQWRYDQGIPEPQPEAGPFSRTHAMDHQVAAVRMGWLPFYPQLDVSPLEAVRRAEAEGAKTNEEVVAWAAEQLRRRTLRFAVEDPDSPACWPRVFLIWRANALHSSARGQELFFRHYLGIEGNAIAAEQAEGMVRDAAWVERAPIGKLDLVVDLNFRMDTSALYSDVILPSASWYEKDDLNTTDLHSYIHPLGQAVPPCWESKPDWEIFRALAARLSALAPPHFPAPFRDLVMTPLLHDTPDELAQPEVRRWYEGECEAIPGRTMPHLSIVERDYASLGRRFCSLGPRLREEGVEDRGIHVPVADLYDALLERGRVEEWGGARYPSVAEPVDAANMILAFGTETNGELAWRSFRVREQQTGLRLADLAEGQRGVRYDFAGLQAEPRRLLTSACWSGIMTGGRAYSGYCQNIERRVPWRTLSGRQHLYLDHPAYRAFGEALPTFKPKLTVEAARHLVASRPDRPSLTLNCLTPHGKWHIHSTYADDLKMLTLSRGIEPFWLNDADAASIGVDDNDWVEAFNDNGVIVTRAAVSARIPRGIGFFYHAPERGVAFPLAPRRGHRGGGTNGVTRLRLKPLLMVGGYAQHSYRFNDYGPPASDRDAWVIVQRLDGPPPVHREGET